MEREEIYNLLSAIYDLWYKFVCRNFKDVDILRSIERIMPNREFIKEVQGKNEDELLKLAWWYDDLSEFIRNNDVQAYVDEVSQFLYRIDADRIIQKWNYYCREYQNGVFTSQEDKRRYYLMLIEFNDEMKGCLVDLHYYHQTSCYWLGRDHMFCRSWDADKLLKLMDISLRYNKEVQHIEDLIKDDPKEKAFTLPVELDTPRARKYIGLAIEKGFIASTDSILKWKLSKARLAYFLFRVFCKDDEGKDNGLKFPESALNRLFGEDRLGKARSQLVDNKKQGYEDIDRLFD